MLSQQTLPKPEADCCGNMASGNCRQPILKRPKLFHFWGIGYKRIINKEKYFPTKTFPWILNDILQDLSSLHSHFHKNAQLETHLQHFTITFINYLYSLRISPAWVIFEMHNANSNLPLLPVRVAPRSCCDLAKSSIPEKITGWCHFRHFHVGTVVSGLPLSPSCVHC